MPGLIQGLVFTAGFATAGLFQRIPERGTAILAAHFVKGSLHKLVPLGGATLTTFLLASLATSFAATLTTLTINTASSTATVFAGVHAVFYPW